MMHALLVLTAVLAVLAGPDAAAAQAAYETGKRHWLDTRYLQAYATLLDYRKETFARKPEVDYMLGTSACRIDCCRDWGRKFLVALPQSYPLSVESRKLVDAEAGLCAQGSNAPAPIADGPDRLHRMVAAGVSGRAKVFSTPDMSVGVTTYPARRVRDVPASELLDRLTPRSDARRAVAVASRLAGQAQVAAYGRFVIASVSGHSRDQLDQIAFVLERFLEFATQRYGMVLPDRYVTIYLVPDPGALRRLADRLHGLDVSPGTIGYAFQEDLSVVAFVTGTAVGTVLHELTHLAVRGTFGDIPQWLDEGMAGLYEVSTVYPDGVFGEPNWRGDVLKALWSRRPTMAAMIATPWFPFDVPESTGGSGDISSPQGEDQVAFMATARYVTLFLERQGHLESVYRAVRDRDLLAGQTPAEAAKMALERAFGVPLAQIDAQFADWFRRGVPRTSAIRPPSAPGAQVEKEIPVQRQLPR
jgi:hypothetical protein